MALGAPILKRIRVTIFLPRPVFFLHYIRSLQETEYKSKGTLNILCNDFTLFKYSMKRF